MTRLNQLKAEAYDIIEEQGKLQQRMAELNRLLAEKAQQVEAEKSRIKAESVAQ